MAISTESMGAVSGMQHRQEINSLIAGGTGGQRTVSATTKANQITAAVIKPDSDQPSTSQLNQSLEDINKALAGFSISVQFQVDPDYKDLIVKIVDQDSGKLIRQMPTEDVVRISKAMDNLKGLLFSQAV